MSSPAMKNLTISLIVCLLAALSSAQSPTPAGTKPATKPATAKQNQAPADNPGSAVGGILVSPLLQRLSCQPGRKAEVLFVTENPGQVVETAQVEIVSFTTEDWTYRTKYGVDHPHDCASWFASRALNVTIQPGARQELRLPITVPRGTAGAYWCMLKFTPRPNGSTTKSLVAYEIPIVMIIGKNPKPVVQVGSPLMRKFNDNSRSKSMMAVLPITNDSDGFSVIGATGTLRNTQSNRIVADFILEDRNLMPQTKRELAFLVPTVPDGTYKLDFKAILGVRSLPPVSSQIIVTKGVPKLASEATLLQTTPITTEPSSLNLAIPAGGQRTTTIKITNNGPREIGLDVRAVSVEQGTNGAIGIGDSGLPYGLSVDISGEMAHLQPGQSALAKVRISVPKEAQGDLWFGLSVKDAGNQNSLADSIFGTVTVPKTDRPEIVVENPTEIKDRSRTIALKYSVRNAGNVALRPEASAAVLADGIRLVDRLAVPEVGDGGILPGKTIQNMVMLPAGLKPGSYVVEVAYQFGAESYGRLRIPVTVAGKPATGKASETKKTSVKQ